ncbi:MULTISPECIES: aromatic ring-hydroxylating dioxygenase subunit alpha [unclassified Novosphingobium]|uniref:aromatic ring-hydroxylating dioxygenase subunit alpha n=1 Tax=unclassified Novosphingobium TaxID=2644732 RepID=UPI0014943B2E|nr:MULTISPECIES: aromatic ring-hydroxylating dioxygenase subunit alpha [unclassified Novosphingobium]MBB3356762.1 vanillate O-demethylase monooxygenase subunit [Novosphingobium sp. BK256]MBB3373163.1 vanillate O-demethylase monooxygenase subunit [Novosphingobium sp. BK280]MBB3377532.1 vanillate O-demethylase monooxygenase subunit [Novosphingobium sp. BK258]MBB3419057.1 vanillate O-demethylase monooxygenase subunit [Novosphingobium sp. BK267]MBB3450108.1 vanillate O-demethylase monooxygenase su
MSDYVRNLWHMAAWENEVPDDGVLARRLLDAPWAIYRLGDGSYAMLADRCPHRFVPLSRGKRVGDMLQCGYHGLGFGADGRCAHTPFATPVPDAQVATRPIVARHGALWFWPGDAALADPALIPDFSFVTDGAEVVCESLLMDAGYEFITDNLMDLSHAEFLHVETFGVNGSLFGGKHSVETDDTGGIWNKWDMVDAKAPEWAKPMLPPGTNTDQKMHIRWHAPASMALFIELTRGDTGQLLVPPMANPHIITPATATTSHYFYTREPGDAAKAMALKVFLEEDEPMIQAAEAGLDGQEFWAARPLILASDAGAVRVRRRMMQLRKREAAEPALQPA